MLDYPKAPHEYIDYCNSLSVSQLDVLQVQISSDIVRINIKLKDDRKYANYDEDWKHKTEVALEHYTWRLNTAKLLQQAKLRDQQAACTFAEAFRFAAEDILPPSLYKQCIEAAHELIENEYPTNPISTTRA